MDTLNLLNITQNVKFLNLQLTKNIFYSNISFNSLINDQLNIWFKMFQIFLFDFCPSIKLMITFDKHSNWILQSDTEHFSVLLVLPFICFFINLIHKLSWHCLFEFNKPIEKRLFEHLGVNKHVLDEILSTFSLN